MEVFLQDVRYALRGLRRSPGFAAAAIATLALGMGATTAIFSVIRAVVLSPLPYAEPDRRVMIWSRWKDFPKTWLATGEIVDYRRDVSSFERVAAWDSNRANLTGDGDPVRIGIAAVTARTFETLGSRLQLGRDFTAEEDREGGPPVAILGYGLWQNRYGGDPDVLGRSIELDGAARRVVGVAPRGFALPTDFTVDATEPSQLYVPAQLDPASTDHGSHGYYGAALLKKGATADRATAELKLLTQALTDQGTYPKEMRFEAFAVPVEEEIRGAARRALALVFGAVGFLMLMACANVANLLLSKAEGRQREIAVRASIGAGQGRLTRQLLTESLVLAPAGLPTLGPIGIDASMLGFAAVLTLATTFLFGFAPALQSLRLNLTQALRDGAGGSSVGLKRTSLRAVLASVQTAIAVLLLLGAGLMLRSLDALMRIDLGFRPEGVLTLELRPPESKYESPESVVAFYRALLEKVRGLPGVDEAGLVRLLPLATEIGDWGLDVEGFEETPGNNAKGDWQVASDGAMEALGERLRAGRSLSASDIAGSLPVVLVNETFARLYWPGQDPIGRRIRMGSDNPDRPWMTVVGVVRDERHNGLTGAIKEKFFVPYAQFPAARSGDAARNMSLIVRTSGDPAALAGPIRAAVRELDPSLPIANVRRMTDVVAASMATPRLTGSLLTIFGGLALFLAAIGVSGVLSYLVSRRRREIGIRVALGASRASVLGLVVRRGLVTAAWGIAAGVLGGIVLTRLMAGMLYGVAPRDPATFAIVAALLLLIALLASAVPAFRAARVDPLEALRAE